MNTVISNAVAKAKNDDTSLKAIDIDTLFWAKSLFQRMGFVKVASTTRKWKSSTVLVKRKLYFFIMKL